MNTTFRNVLEAVATEKAKAYGLTPEDILPFYANLGIRHETHLLTVYQEVYENPAGHHIYKDVMYNTINHKSRLTVRTNWAGEEINRKVTNLETKHRTREEFYIEAIQAIQV